MSFFDSGLKIYLELLAGLSITTFLLSIFCIPFLVAALPANYFHPLRQPSSPFSGTTKVIVSVLRNIVGSILFLAGVAMLFLPGQGIITMVVAVAVMSFPSKRIILIRATRHHSIQTSLDWVRKKMHKQPFLWQ